VEWVVPSSSCFANAVCRSARWSYGKTNGPRHCEPLAQRSLSATSPGLRTSRVLWPVAGGCISVMSVSAPISRGTVTAAAVARQHRDLEGFVNISQMAVSQMGLMEVTDSPQQRQHWLGEQVAELVRTTRRARDLRCSSRTPSSPTGLRNRSPRTARFGCRSAPGEPRRSTLGIVAEVIAVILANPAALIGKVTN
jgi:hypothetical protein